MVRCYQVDLRVNGGFTLAMAFEAMKKMQQETDLIDESVTISYDDKVRLTAGFYDNFEQFFDLFSSVLWNDKEFIKKHVSSSFPKCLDPEVIELAIKNIAKSMNKLKYDFTDKDKEELLKLAGLSKGYTKRI